MLMPFLPHEEGDEDDDDDDVNEDGNDVDDDGVEKECSTLSGMVMQRQ